ncbi:glycosyltransferase [Halococcus dombrowskii]|uniref:Glycosyltransferase n=1 Tax=Halococcus dombrowskii TaxID=179637 RepID=A0AAX3AQB1_HALDO|nr:glycosyltransferase [Halococcus dombrowskii]UOO95127.1 glycosyltransferase [Halococcus dombrowskii]
MAQIAVLHNTLDFQGGADAVCLAVCDALQRDHDITLFTVSETAPATLADRFDVTLSDVRVRMPPGAAAVAGALSGAAPWIGPQLALRSVLLERFFRSSATPFDLAVSTANELSLSIPSVQYIHYPQFHLHRLADGDPGRLNRLLSRLAGPSSSELAREDTVLLANSSWTADVVADVYETRPEVLHPPVDPIPCELAWEQREDGLVAVGRLAPDKRLLDVIAVVDAIRDRGYDLHLHVVGAAPRAYRRYAERVAAAANERPYVSLERDVPRNRLEQLLCTHKYGLNMKQGEHFGMVVAEYVAAGMVAFAPASGGQQDVLGNRHDRLFDSVDEAVSLITNAMAANDPPELQPDRFAREQFQTSLRRYVNESLTALNR